MYTIRLNIFNKYLYFISDVSSLCLCNFMSSFALGLLLARQSRRATQKEEMILRTLTSHGCISTGCCVVLLYAGTSWSGSSVRQTYHRNLNVILKICERTQAMATDECNISVYANSRPT